MEVSPLMMSGVAGGAMVPQVDLAGRDLGLVLGPLCGGAAAGSS